MTELHRMTYSISLFAALCAACVSIAGCAVRDAILPDSAKQVALAEFAKGEGSGIGSTSSHAHHDEVDGKVELSASDAPPAEVMDGNAAAASAGANAPQSQPSSRTRRLQPGELYIVDSLVGQINGRPVYADTFFAPIENQLIEERRQLGDIAFRDRAWDLILTHLNTLVEDELFLAEAQASLKPEERQGLFSFMRYMRERTIAQGGGTLSGAQQRLEESGEGTSVDQFVEGRLNEELIRRLLHEKIMPRVIVSWRDVEREYRRRESEFNPPPTLHLSRIRINNDQPEQIEQVKEMLAAGKPFAEVARSVGQDDGIWQSFVVGPEGFHDIAISDAIKPSLEGLDLGDTTEPIVLSTSTMWLHLADFEQTQRSLYDLEVQRSLLRHLHDQRFGAEHARYLNSLLEDRVRGDLTAMARRLLEVALHRYGGVNTEAPAS